MAAELLHQRGDIGDSFLGFPLTIQAEYAWTIFRRLSSQCTRVRLSATAAGPRAAAGVLGARPLELAGRRDACGGDAGSSSDLRQRFGSEALGIEVAGSVEIDDLRRFATNTLSRIFLKLLKSRQQTLLSILNKFRLRS